MKRTALPPTLRAWPIWDRGAVDFFFFDELDGAENQLGGRHEWLSPLLRQNTSAPSVIETLSQEERGEENKKENRKSNLPPQRGTAAGFGSFLRFEVRNASALRREKKSVFNLNACLNNS